MEATWMKVGFIGLGHLGKTMAKRLIDQGVELTVWNRTKEKASGIGVPVADSPAKLASQSDVVFINLFDSNAVRSVLLGEDGVLQADVKGKIVIDTTTNHFMDVAQFHEALTTKEAIYLESPVLGSVIPASQGNLTVLVSGDEGAFASVKLLLEKIASNIFYLGPGPSVATRMKLINNLLLGTFMTSISEAVIFAESSGIGKEKALDILAAGAGSSMVLNAKRKKLLDEDFSTHFSAALIYKDLHYLEDLARTLKRPLFTGSTAKELFALTFKDEKEKLDFSVVYDVLRQL